MTLPHSLPCKGRSPPVLSHCRRRPFLPCSYRPSFYQRALCRKRTPKTALRCMSVHSKGSLSGASINQSMPFCRLHGFETRFFKMLWVKARNPHVQIPFPPRNVGPSGSLRGGVPRPFSFCFLFLRFCFLFRVVWGPRWGGASWSSGILRNLEDKK